MSVGAFSGVHLRGAVQEIVLIQLRSAFSLQHLSRTGGFVPAGPGSGEGLRRVDDSRLFREPGGASPEARNQYKSVCRIEIACLTISRSQEQSQAKTRPPPIRTEGLSGGSLRIMS